MTSTLINFKILFFNRQFFLNFDDSPSPPPQDNYFSTERSVLTFTILYVRREFGRANAKKFALYRAFK